MLKSVPLYDLPAYVINLRQIVLNSLGYSTTESSALFELLKEQVASNVSFIPQTQLPKCSSLDQDSFKILDNAHRLELSHWIRTNLVSWTSLQESKTLIASKESGSKALGILDYTYVTSLLIGFHDYAVLADILEIFIDFGGKELLEIISDTINTNFEILYALGAADSLFCSLIHRLEYLVSRSPTEKGLLASLVDLAERLPKRTRTTEQLRTELALCEPRSALAACSPVSDNMVEALQTSDSGFWEEVELLFSSGISMDKPLLLRMFIDITKRLETIWDDDEVVLGTYFDILARLRSFGPEVFDTIMLGWIGEALLSTSRPPLKRLLPSLICARAIKLQSILKQFVSHLETSRVIRTLLIVEVLDIFVAREVHASSQLLRDCALLCVSTQPLTSSQRDYRYLLEVEEILRNESGLISNLVRLLMEHSLLGDTDSKAVAEEFMASPGFSELLQCILIASPNDAENSFPILPPRRETLLILNRLLGNAGQSHLMNTRIDDHFVDLVEAVSPETIIKDILQIADDFNLSICKAKLRIFVGMAYQEESGLGLEPDKIAQILAQEAASSFTSNSSIWQGLLSALPLEIAAKVRS